MINMWTNEQSSALDAVNAWFKSGDAPSYYLAGYAGTGKTTLARHFAEHVDGVVKFGAFTGKAASVLRSKGCANATTIHSLIYKPVSSNAREQHLERTIKRETLKGDAKCERTILECQQELEALRNRSNTRFEKREFAEISEADLVIIDECSMIDAKMGADLESYGVPILYLGDPGQLPPVFGKGLLATRKPDYVLNEIHRQAAESAIIRIANDIRMGKLPGIGDYGELCVQRKDAFDWDYVASVDQVLCGKNETRRRLNRGLRQKAGHAKLYPVEGDKLVCLKNHRESGTFNGVTCVETRNSEKVGECLNISVLYDGEDVELQCSPVAFEENYGTAMTTLSREAADDFAAFDYGYAITVHKSQGSQFDDVVVCDDRMRENDTVFRRQWLYTAVTRAAQSVLIYT